jgi:hypothetical protein
MNKRIKKKQMRLKRFKVGDTIYDRKKVSEFNKLNMGLMNILSLYSKIKVPLPKWSQPRINGLMNYIYKNRMRLHKTYEHHRFATSLDIYKDRNTINHTPIPIVATKHTDITYSPIKRKEDEK